MSNIFYTADGKKFNLENFADIAPSSQSQTQSNVKTFDDSLRLKGNLSLDGTIRASRYLMEDGSDMKLSSSQSGLPSNVSFDAQGNMNMSGNMNMNGNMNTTGTIKAGKYLMADGSEMKAGGSTQSGFPSSVSFDAQGNMIMNGGLTTGGSINTKGTINISGGEAAKIQTPDGNLRMNNQGIQFGGGNIKRQINSAQITAGMHIPDSLNIVGMHSKDNYDEDRKVHMWAESGFNVFGGINVAANPNPAADQAVNINKIKNPNGTLKINNHGIQFGGSNVAGREVNSAQISAGLHVPNSLNIVGMASDGSESNRKVNMWAEGGFTVSGPIKASKYLMADGSEMKVGGPEMMIAGGPFKSGGVKKITRLTMSAELTLDDHFVIVSGTSIFNPKPIIIRLPENPLDGQEYYIKCTSGLSNVSVEGGYGRRIMTAAVGGDPPYLNFSMKQYQTAWLVYNKNGNIWMMML